MFEWVLWQPESEAVFKDYLYPSQFSLRKPLFSKQFPLGWCVPFALSTQAKWWCIRSVILVGCRSTDLVLAEIFPVNGFLRMVDGACGWAGPSYLSYNGKCPHLASHWLPSRQADTCCMLQGTYYGVQKINMPVCMPVYWGWNLLPGWCPLVLTVCEQLVSPIRHSASKLASSGGIMVCWLCLIV